MEEEENAEEEEDATTLPLTALEMRSPGTVLEKFILCVDRVIGPAGYVLKRNVRGSRPSFSNMQGKISKHKATNDFKLLREACSWMLDQNTTAVETPANSNNSLTLLRSLSHLLTHTLIKSILYTLAT